ncbi:hypothetical protein EDB19DRAFT_1704778, partial [Suillus lakei]
PLLFLCGSGVCRKALGVSWTVTINFYRRHAQRTAKSSAGLAEYEFYCRCGSWEQADSSSCNIHTLKSWYPFSQVAAELWSRRCTALKSSGHVSSNDTS